MCVYLFISPRVIKSTSLLLRGSKSIVPYQFTVREVDWLVGCLVPDSEKSIDTSLVVWFDN